MVAKRTRQLISLCENDFYRSYDVVYRLPEDVKTTHDEVHKLVFMTCLRMATYKEYCTSSCKSNYHTITAMTVPSMK
jgi:hypothetical protein